MTIHIHKNCTGHGCEGLCCLELKDVGVTVGADELQIGRASCRERV